MENNSVAEQIAAQDRVAAAKIKQAGGFNAPPLVHEPSRGEKLRAARVIARKLYLKRYRAEEYADPVYRAAIIDRERRRRAKKAQLVEVAS